MFKRANGDGAQPVPVKTGAFQARTSPRAADEVGADIQAEVKLSQ
jgi:hypothetical protein